MKEPKKVDKKPIKSSWLLSHLVIDHDRIHPVE